MSEQAFKIRSATPNDVENISTLILEHGPNKWNYLPEEDIRNYVGSLGQKETSAVVAETPSGLIGVVTYDIFNSSEYQQRAGDVEQPHGYISEAVVQREEVGHGIGSLLLDAAIKEVKKTGVWAVYAMRHADNIPSGRMMEKNGMEVVATYDDPEHRPTGSGLTIVTRRILRP